MSRVAAIGLDAFEWWLAERLMAAGKLPHLRALSERSAFVELENVVENRSEMTWVQLLTGRSAEQLRWPGQLRFDAEHYRPFGHGTLEGLVPFYAGTGKRTISFDVIHATIAQEVEGVQVTGWGAHSPQYWRASDPVGLLATADDRFGTNPAFNNDSELCWYEPDYIDNLADAAVIGTGRRISIVEWLAAEHPDWELLITCMSEIHGVGHNLWHGVDDSHPLHAAADTTELAGRRMEDICVETDRALGRFLDLLPPDTTVVVFALHGMLPADDLPASVLLPEVAHRQHLGRPALRGRERDQWVAEGCPPATPSRHETWHGYMRRRFTSGPTDVARHLFNRMPAPVYDLGRRLAGKPPAVPLGPLLGTSPPEVAVHDGLEWRETFDWHPATWYQRFWPKMPWFVLPTFDHSYIRVNVAGREGQGIVDLDDYAKACEQAAASVRGLRNAATGAPLVADVRRLRDDPHDPDGPAGDLLVLWESGADAVDHADVGFVGPFPQLRTGSHSSNGFAFIAGPGVASGHRGRRSAFDITPTLLTLMGCPVPEGLAGTAIDVSGGIDVPGGVV